MFTRLAPRRIRTLLLSVVLGSFTPLNAQTTPVAWVTVKKGPVAVMLDPKPDSVVVGLVLPGTALEVRQVRGDWYWVVLPKDPEERAARSGWIPASLVVPTSPPAVPPPAEPVPAPTSAPTPAPKPIIKPPPPATATQKPAPIRPEPRVAPEPSIATPEPALPRVEISANVGAQTPESKFTESGAFPSNGGELSTVTVDHNMKTGLGFNLGAAVRVVPKLWVGVQYAMANMNPNASLEAVIPHPLIFNAPRAVQGAVNDVAHKEQRVHVALMYALPIRAVDVRVIGGPTFFILKRDFVSGVTINETYPFDTATFASATRKQLSDTATGFNAGIDISRALTSQVAVGGIIRYSRADVKFDHSEIGKHTVTAGGIETLAGVRFRF